MIRLKLALIGIGALLVFWGFQEWKLTWGADATPQEISCEDLGLNGPGDNAHVVMTDFILSQEDFVYEYMEDNPDKYLRVYMAAFPRGGEYHKALEAVTEEEADVLGNARPPIRTMRVLIKSTEVENDEDLWELMQTYSIQGLVINEIEEIEGEELRLLQEGYMAVDFSSVVILEHLREPSEAGTVVKFFVLGAALLAVGVGWFIVDARRA